MAHKAERFQHARPATMEGLSLVTQMLSCSSRNRDALFFIPGPEYPSNPYSLIQTTNRKNCRGEHWMIYPGGFLHVGPDGNSDRLNPYDWVRDARIFSRLVRLDFFHTMRLRKTFSKWIRTARANAFSRRRRNLSKAMRFQQPYFTVLTEGLHDLRLSLDEMNCIPGHFDSVVFEPHAFSDSVSKLTERSIRRAFAGIHTILDRIHMLCFQLFDDLNQCLRRLRAERCPSTYDSPVLGTSRSRVAELLAKRAQSQRLEAMLPSFVRLLFVLIQQHIEACMLKLADPLSSRLSASESPLLIVELVINGGEQAWQGRRRGICARMVPDPAAGGGGDGVPAGEAGVHGSGGISGEAAADRSNVGLWIYEIEDSSVRASAQLQIEPNRAFVEARLREVARSISYSVKTSADRALKPMLESWARRQPPTFDSKDAPNRVLANEIRFIHLLRDDPMSGVQYNARLCVQVASAMASDFSKLNAFIEENQWIILLYNDCMANPVLSKSIKRLDDAIAELIRLLDWDQMVKNLPDSFSAALLTMDLKNVREQLEYLLRQRADFLIGFLLSSVGVVKSLMFQRMAEIPSNFHEDGNAQLSEWYYHVTEFIRCPYQFFGTIGAANRFLVMLTDAGWENTDWRLDLLNQVRKTTAEVNDQWTTYLGSIYGRYSELLSCLAQRRAGAHDRYKQTLLVVQRVYQEINELPRWPGDSDVIMKALIPGFDSDMETRLTSRIQDLFEDVDRLESLELEMSDAMHKLEEAERILSILFQEKPEAQYLHKMCVRIHLKQSIWVGLHKLLVLAQTWLKNMKNMDLRQTLTTALNTWAEQRRHFQSDIGTERLSIRFWRDRMEEVRRVVVMMEAVQGGDSHQSDGWSPIVGKLRRILAAKESTESTDTDNASQEAQERTNQDNEDTDPRRDATKDTAKTGPLKETQEDTLTKHVSVIYAQISQQQKSFSAKELIDSMNAKLARIELTIERYIPQFVMDKGLLMSEEVYTVCGGIDIQTEVMFNVSALLALTEWDVKTPWWRQVLVTTEQWERAALVVRQLLSVQREWVELNQLVNVGVAPALPSLQQVTNDYCQLTGDLQRQPRLAAHDFPALLIRLRKMNSLLTEYFSCAGTELEQLVRRIHENDWSSYEERVPKILDADMERQLRICAEDEGLVLHTTQMASLIDIHRAMTRQRMVIVTGEAGTGKSTMIQLLLTAKQAILAGGIDDMYSCKNSARVMDRVLVGPRPLHHLVRAAAMMGTLPTVEEWLVLDHDWSQLDELVCSMAPVVARNLNLLLVLETSDLDAITPADRHVPCVSLTAHKLSWRMLIRAWLSQVAKTTLYRGEIGTLEKLTESLFPATIDFLSRHHTTLSRYSTDDQLASGYLGCHFVTMFEQLFSALMEGFNALMIRHGNVSLVVHRVAAFAYIWAFGGSLERRHRPAFNEEARRLMSEAGGIGFPHDDTVYDHTLDSHAHWCGWRLQTGDHVSSTGRHWHVNVPQQTSVAHIAVTLLRRNVNILLYGPRGSGKTQVLQHLLAPKFQAAPLDHAPYAPAETAGRHLASLCARITRPRPKPAIFIDDLHFATQGDPAGLQHLVREQIRLHGFRSGEDFEFHSNGVLPVFATAIDLPSAAISLQDRCTAVTISKRLKHHSFVLSLPRPDEELISGIFGPVIKFSVFKYLPADCKSSSTLFTDMWMGATCQLYRWLHVTLRANAVRPGRAFNLHHVSRCSGLAVESACRLLDRSDISGSQRERIGYVLPEVWLYAAENVFQRRLECSKDIERFCEESKSITDCLRKRFKEGGTVLEMEEKEVREMEKAETERLRRASKKVRRSFAKYWSPGIEDNKSSTSRRRKRKRSKKGGKKHRSHSSSSRRGSGRSRSSSKRSSKSKKSRKHSSKKKGKKKRSSTSEGSSRTTSKDGKAYKSLIVKVASTKRRGKHRKKRKNSNEHFRKATYISERRRELNEDLYGKQVYVKPKSRWADLGLNDIFKHRQKQRSVKGEFIEHELVHDEEDESDHGSDGINKNEGPGEVDIRLMLASSVILHNMRDQFANGSDIPDTFEELLEQIMEKFSIKHPDSLPGALPADMTDVLLTMVQSLSTSSRCTTVIRDKGTPGLRTLIELACSVTQFELVDLRRHAIDDEDVIPELCRCVLRALFENCKQCLYVAETSRALELVHAVVTSRLPLQVVYSNVWRDVADKMGLLRRLAYLEENNMLLQVAGNCMSRHLHVAVSCTLGTDEAPLGHFPTFRLSSQWPSFFNHVTVFLPAWSMESYICLAHRYLMVLDTELNSKFACETLAKLHLATVGNLVTGMNSLSFLYQLCEAFTVCYRELTNLILPRMDRLMFHIGKLHKTRLIADRLVDEVTEITETLDEVNSNYQEIKETCIDLEAKRTENREKVSQLSEEQVKVAFELHSKNTLLDKSKQTVSKLHIIMGSVSEQVDFNEAVQELNLFYDPPRPVILLGNCICVLFDKQETWEEARGLLKIEGFDRILALVTFDIISEDHMDTLQLLLPADNDNDIRDELSKECPSAVPLLEWFQKLSYCAMVHLKFMQSVAESTKLSEKFADLQNGIDAARQSIATFAKEREVFLQRRSVAAEELQKWRLHQIHAIRRRDWLGQIADSVWREETGQDGSKAIGHRLCDEFFRFYKILCHLPAIAAILAATTSFSGWKSSSDTPGLQLWLQTLACPHHPKDCICEEVDMPFPTSVLDNLPGLPNWVRLKADAFSQGFRRHPLHYDAISFLKEDVIPVWFSYEELLFYQKQREYCGEHALFLRVLLWLTMKRRSCLFIAVSDPENKLLRFMDNMSISMPSIAEEGLEKTKNSSSGIECLLEADQRYHEDEKRPTATSCEGDNQDKCGGIVAMDKLDTRTPVLASPRIFCDRASTELNLSDLRLRTSSSFLEESHSVSSANRVRLLQQNDSNVLKQRQVIHYDDVTHIAIDSPETVDIKLLMSHITNSKHRLLLSNCGSASPLADRLLAAHRGKQHLVTHIKLAIPPEGVSERLDREVVRRLRPQGYHDERTSLHDLGYWLGRREMAENQMLGELPQLLKYLKQLQPPKKCSMVRSVLSTDVSSPAPVVVESPSHSVKALRQNQRRFSLRLPNARIKDSSSASMVNLSLVPAPFGLGSTASLMDKLDRRRRSTSASISLAKSWRNKIKPHLRPLLSGTFSEEITDNVTSFENIKEEHKADESLLKALEQRAMELFNSENKLELTVSDIAYTGPGQWNFQPVQCPEIKENSKGTAGVSSEFSKKVGFSVNEESKTAILERSLKARRCAVNYGISPLKKSGNVNRPRVDRVIKRRSEAALDGSCDQLPKMTPEPKISEIERTASSIPAKTVSKSRRNPEIGQRQSASVGAQHETRPNFQRKEINSRKQSRTFSSQGPRKPSTFTQRRRARSLSGHRKSKSLSRRRKLGAPHRAAKSDSESDSPRLRERQTQPLQPLKTMELAHIVLLSLQARKNAFLEIVSEVDSADASIANFKRVLAELAEQKKPLRTVTEFLAGLYEPVSALCLHSRHLNLESFAEWLKVSLRVRAAANIEYKKSADYFKFLCCYDIMPRVLERLPEAWHVWYMILAALTAAGWVGTNRLRLFVRGPSNTDGWRSDWMSACPDWVDEREWLSLSALGQQSSGISQLMAKLHEGDAVGWKERLEVGPDILNRGELTVDEWALVWCALQPSAILKVSKQIINFTLGPISEQMMEEMPSIEDGPNQILQHLGGCVPALPYPGMSLRLMEKLYYYVNDLLSVLRNETPLEANDPITPKSKEKPCPWSVFLASEVRDARRHLSLIHDELSDLRRLLMTRIPPSDQLEELVTALSLRSVPERWQPPGEELRPVPRLLRHCFACILQAQALAVHVKEHEDLVTTPIPLELSQFFTPMKCMESVRATAAFRLDLEPDQVAITVIDDTHPEPNCVVRVLLDTVCLTRNLRQHMNDCCVGWRRRPRTDNILLVACGVTEMPERPESPDKEHEPQESFHLLDPTMTRYLKKMRRSFGEMR